MSAMTFEGTFVALAVAKSPVDGNITVHFDKMMTCPLDESHIISTSNLQSHLERCLIGDLITMTCPWNSLHVLDETSYENHKYICEDKPPGLLMEDQKPNNQRNKSLD